MAQKANKWEAWGKSLSRVEEEMNKGENSFE